MTRLRNVNRSIPDRQCINKKEEKKKEEKISYQATDKKEDRKWKYKNIKMRAAGELVGKLRVHSIVQEIEKRVQT